MTSWQTRGACRTEDPELFFPDGTSGRHAAQAEEAKAICNTRCPVRDTCLDWALEQRQDSGVWGGTTEQERRRIHRRKARVPVVSQAPRSLAAVLAERSVQVDDGHTEWLSTTPVTVNQVCYTPAQLAWHVAYGEAPDGEVRSRCGRTNCITVSHLLDGAGRAALHGTWAAWSAHRKADEPLCELCQAYDDEARLARNERDRNRRAAKKAAA